MTKTKQTAGKRPPLLRGGRLLLIGALVYKRSKSKTEDTSRAEAELPNAYFKVATSYIFHQKHIS